MGDESVAKIPFGFLVGNFARSMDERGNMEGKVSEETKVGRIRCENRPDSNTEPLRSLVQFVISRDIPRHSPEITAIFHRASVSIFLVLASWKHAR